MRVKVGWRSGSRESYKSYCNKYPESKLSFDQWKSIIYGFNESFRDYILETGEKVKFPYDFGEFTINKRKKERIVVVDGKEYVNLPVDWVKTRQKGKKVYNLNYHTEGYFFGWMWSKPRSVINGINFKALWYFKPSRVTSRLLAHYLKINNKYQHLYREWKH